MAVRSNFLGNNVLRFAVLLCLFESIISILFAIVGIQIFQCKSDYASFPVNPEDFNWWRKVIFLVYITYFRDCDDLTKPADSSYNVHFRSASLVIRTYNWILIYLVLSSLWMITSLFLSKYLFKNTSYVSQELHMILMTDVSNSTFQIYRLKSCMAVLAKNRITRRVRLYLCCPWVLMTVIVIFTDAFATVQYLLDLLITTDVKGHPKEEHSKDFSLAESDIANRSNDIFYIPPITMSVIFSRGGIVWILNTILVILIISLLISRTKKESESASATNEASTEDVASHTSTAMSELSVSARDPDYVPWMNVLYIPSTCKDFNEQDENVATGAYDEHCYEHHYERVVCPNDIPRPFNIGVPPTIKTDPELYRMAGYYNNLSLTEPRLLKIDCGSISIHINRKTPHPFSLSPNYIDIPRVQIAKLRPKCSTTDCNIHHVNNETTTSF